MLPDPCVPLDHLPLGGAPDAPALLLRDRAIDYQTLNVRTGRLAGWLSAQLPQPGARVASWLPKQELACLLPLAAARAGLVHVPINPVLKRAQVAHIVADSGAGLLIANAARLATLAPNDSAAAATADAEAVATALEAEGSALLPSATDGFDADALVAILYTSGSTGRPKGVMLSHRNLMLGADAVARYLKLDASDVTLALLPLAFDYGQNQLFSAWRAGGAAAPIDYLTARDAVKAVARHGVTTLAGVPPLWQQLVEQDWPDDAVAPLRRLTNSGGALTPALVKRLRAQFPAASLYAMYGITEAFRSTYLDPALIDRHPTSIGTAIPHAEIAVVRPDGSVAADGEEGELVHCGPLVALGYWRDDGQRGAERFRPAPAWASLPGRACWSGDRVRREADGLHYFIGRTDAMIKVSGHRISPQEIEEAATAPGLAAEACAVGVSDDRLGARIILFVRGADDMNALTAALKAELPAYMQPAHIEPLAALPLSPNGKIDRVALAAQAAALTQDEGVTS